jgi:hypothetical protein|tara:strand:+ start:4144 stop:4245 length:102 start_codon:yes stop_codon:yes gene_type:complete
MGELQFALTILLGLPVFYYTIKLIVWIGEKLEK